MTCADIVDLVTDYLEGTLSEADRARFDEHLAECPMCRVHLDRMRRIIRELGALHERDIEPAVLAEMQVRFRDWHTTA
jgi:anti-sigma factor RsiW